MVTKKESQFIEKNIRLLYHSACRYIKQKPSLKEQGFYRTEITRAGLEPARAQCSLDFKSNVSTNSTTWATCQRKIPIFCRDSLSERRDSNPRP